MKVLLALDGSAPSLVARDLVAGLRWPADTVTHLVSGYHIPVDWTGGVGSTMAWVGDVEDAIRDELTTTLTAAAKPLLDRGLAVEQHVIAGRASDVILDAAERLAVDVVVTGSRGRGPLRSMLLGSVAAEIAARAPCPVLVARGTTIERLLVATDGSPASERIPSMLQALAVFGGLPADVVSVAVPDSPAYELMTRLYTISDERVTREREALKRRSIEDADEMARALAGAGNAATPHARDGDATEQILAQATDSAADLIVVGSRGLGAIERLILGSVARNVLVHADASVLIMRAASAGVPTPKEA